MTLHCDVLILGAGLTGLVAARTLMQAGVIVKLLEARPRIGGRIYSVRPPYGPGVFDLGPTWVWPDHTHIQQLAGELGVPLFPQFDQGDTLYELGCDAPIQRFLPEEHAPLPYRFVGGVQALVDNLRIQFPPHTIDLATMAQSISWDGVSLTVKATTTSQVTFYRSRHVIITLPPRLAASMLQFVPPLPPDVLSILRKTETWMGHAMKVLLVYHKPFWRSMGLSGLAVSTVGPVDQFYDATPIDAQVGGLFGWLGDANIGRTLAPHIRRQAIIKQAVRLFGDTARNPLHFDEINWANEPFTSIANDSVLPENGDSTDSHLFFQAPQMAGRLHFAGAETSPVHSGYLDGAVYSGHSTAQHLINLLT